MISKRYNSKRNVLMMSCLFLMGCSIEKTLALPQSQSSDQRLEDDSSIWKQFENDSFDNKKLNQTDKVLNLQSDSQKVPIYYGCNVPNSFSITFDDGPSQYSVELDSLIKSSGSRASYFINGNNVGCIFDHADLLKQRFQEGHLIGSHTWSHPNLPECSREKITEEIVRVEDAMIKILGVKPLYFRPPYGAYNDVVLEVLAERGYKGLILWNQDTKDSDQAPPGAPEMIEAFKQFPGQTISLSHETMEDTVSKVIPAAIPDLKSKGFNLIPATACLSLGSDPNEWYVKVGEPKPRDDSWTCN